MTHSHITLLLTCLPISMIPRNTNVPPAVSVFSSVLAPATILIVAPVPASTASVSPVTFALSSLSRSRSVPKMRRNVSLWSGVGRISVLA